jgi:4'-phosphopantetheinyl transferase
MLRFDPTFVPAPFPRAMPAAGEILLGAVALDGAAPEVFDELSADERERAARFRIAAHRARFAVARASLRRVLGGILGIDPRSLIFTYGERGKPAIAPEHNLAFNVSHSGGLALIALSRPGNLGVDVEQIVELDDAPAIARRTFSAAENEELGRVAPSERLLAFYLAWTRKESVVKALGSGLAMPLDSFDVSLTPGEPALVRAARGGAAQLWQLHDARPAERFAAAVAFDGAAASVRRERWQ